MVGDISNVDKPAEGLLRPECSQLDFEEIFSVKPEVSLRRRFWKITMQHTDTCSLCGFSDASVRALGIFLPEEVLGIRTGLVSEACELNDKCIAERLPGCTTLDSVALQIDQYDYLVKTFTSSNTPGIIEGGGFLNMGYMGARVGAHLILPTKVIASNDLRHSTSPCDTVLGRQVLVKRVDYGLVTE